MTPWLLIDDNHEEATSFAKKLSSVDRLIVEHLSASDAIEALESGNFSAAGVLMDVDLSNELGQRQTGPGMSQDIRVAQQNETIGAFPIVRFSLREKILINIGRDSSSDDIFDLKIEKDGLSVAEQCSEAQSKLIGVREIYDALSAEPSELPALLGLTGEQWSRWGSSNFEQDVEQGDRIHLRAYPFTRLLSHPGLLIEEDLLAFRLGVSKQDSKGWLALVEQLSFSHYSGVGSAEFKRWWARSIEEWWQDELKVPTPLAGCSIDKRYSHLNERFDGLLPLKMPDESLGDRPWRHCTLTMEQRQELLPVDPSKSVKLKPRSRMPTWLDPLYAALGVALQNRDDPRLDKEDLRRLKLLVRSQR